MSFRAKSVCIVNESELWPDNYLWENLEERVYINRQENLEDLGDNIRREIRANSPTTLCSVKAAAHERACHMTCDRSTHDTSIAKLWCCR